MDRNVGGYNVPGSEAGTQRAAEIERREAEERAAQREETADAYRRASEAAQAAPRSAAVSSAQPSKGAPPSKGEAPAPAEPSGTSSKGLLFGLALIAGVLAGFVQYSEEPEPVAAVVTGAIVFALAVLALWVLWTALRIALQVVKVALPIVAVIFVGNLLGWGWAQSAMDWLRDAGSSVVQAAEEAWAEAQSD